VPGTVLTAGFRQLVRTLRGARAYPQTLAFLLAYLVYNDGIQSVIGLAGVYGVEELGLEQSTLISAILLVQFVAFLGALLLGRAARRYGAKRVVLASLALWTGTVAVAYFVERGAAGQFFVLAALIGLVLGGSQALSRSLFCQLIPPGKEAEYFGLYEISERGTSWLGALTFGLVFQLSGSYRYAIFSLVAFFVVGFLLLARVDVREGIRAAGNEQPRLV
jgi:UMF1 family MFS transporter